MKILSIDLSINHFGYAYFNNDNLIKYEAIDVAKIIKKKDNYEREEYIYNFFDSFLKNNEVDYIILENLYMARNPKTSLQLQNIFGIILSLTFRYKAKLKSYYTKSYRSILKIKSSKREVVKIEVEDLIKRLFVGLENDKEYDISDAISLNLAFQIENEIRVLLP